MNQSMSKKSTAIYFDDNIVIRKFIGGLEGGRTLDCTGFTGTIRAGHVIIKLASGNYAPMPITASGAYASLPSGASYAGILYRSVLVDSPAASIMTNGEVNPKAVPYPLTAILSAFKAACPFIEFESDEESGNPLKVSKEAMTLAASGTDTASVSGAIGSVTVTSSTDTLTATLSGTTLTVTAGATPENGTITLTDAAGQKATIAVTISA